MGHRGRVGEAVFARALLNGLDLGHDRVHRFRQALMHEAGLMAFHEVRLVAVALEQLRQFLRGMRASTVGPAIL